LSKPVVGGGGGGRRRLSCCYFSYTGYWDDEAVPKLFVVAGKMFAFEVIAASHHGGQIPCTSSSNAYQALLHCLQD